VIHPVVRVRPGTGRKVLFVNEGFTTRIIGVPDEENRLLLAELFSISTEDRFVYRHKWQPSGLLFWDNRQNGFVIQDVVGTSSASIPVIIRLPAILSGHSERTSARCEKIIA
jgi:hypothetical protein